MLNEIHDADGHVLRVVLPPNPERVRVTVTAPPPLTAAASDLTADQLAEFGNQPVESAPVYLAAAEPELIEVRPPSDDDPGLTIQADEPVVRKAAELALGDSVTFASANARAALYSSVPASREGIVIDESFKTEEA